MIRLNNELHDRVYDLEAQVIKANDNLHIVIDGMRDFVKRNMLPILRMPFIDTLNYVESLIDWNLTIDISRYEDERAIREH